MIKQQIVMFDLDDTLVHCNKYFDLVLEQFADQMLTWYASFPLTVEQVKKRQLEIDIKGVGLHGFSTDHFPNSLVEAYYYYADLFGRSASLDEADWLLKLGASVYDQQVEPYPYMKETLDAMREAEYELYLYTGGMTGVQLKKVQSLQLGEYFGDRIFIRQHKTTAALEEILYTQRFDRKRTWMIGNSLRTDIVPALETGIHSIYIPAITEWQFNMVDITAKPKGAFLTLQSLLEVPGAIEHYMNELSSKK